MSGKRKSFLDFFKMDDSDDEYDDYEDDMFDEEDDDDEEESYTPSFSFRKEKKSRPAKEEPVKEEKTYTPQTTSYRPPSYNTNQAAPTPRPSYSQQTQQPKRTSTPSRSQNNLVSFDGGQEKRSKYTPSSEVYVIKPVEIDDAQTVVDFLKKNRAIVINMEGLALDPAQRIIDFIGGACYGINGELKAISSNIFIAVPNSMEVSGDLREEILTSPSLSE